MGLQTAIGLLQILHRYKSFFVLFSRFIISFFQKKSVTSLHINIYVNRGNNIRVKLLIFDDVSSIRHCLSANQSTVAIYGS